ncbi:uncharacterized protein LOC122505078 isoform X2 [Leptopilina heterotoma]|uniref:uncharacterized protein LOC122505078 isoform X2 n=1 Tax=Leptopilina heterotoma TaxID=63436 RepID=UPI001CA8C256|nr:uncharacterized protein LOC122505078 isoform X2 [Leptopilina heterotoma]
MDDDEWYVPPVKHYKLALYPHCDTRQISERRKRVWEKAFEQLSEAKENSPFDPSVQQHSSKKNVEVPVLDENGQFQTYDYFNDNEINNEEDSEDDITFSEHLREGATEHPNLNKSSNFIDNGPKFKNLNLTNYKLSKIFDPPPHVTTYNFYCNNCFEKVVHSSSKLEIKGQSSICEHCKTFHR